MARRFVNRIALIALYVPCHLVDRRFPSRWANRNKRYIIMVKLKSILKWSFIVLILLFIYFPIIFLTINSFNESDVIQSGWQGFSVEHYKYFFNFENEPIRVVLQTILLALVVAFLSCILGTIGAIGIFYSKKHFWKKSIFKKDLKNKKVKNDEEERKFSTNRENEFRKIIEKMRKHQFISTLGKMIK